MANTSVELRQERAKVLTRGREILDAAEAENRDLSADEQKNWDQVTADVTAINKRLERAEFLELQPATDPEHRSWDLNQDAKTDPKTPEEAEARNKRAYSDAFRSYLTAPRTGMIPAETWETLYRGGVALSKEEQRVMQSVLRPEQLRAMSVGSQTGGGFWVPDEMFKQIEQAMLWFGGMRSAAKVLTTESGADLPWPVYDDTANSGRRLAENSAATQTDLAVGLRLMKAFMYTSDEVLVSLQLLQDVPEIAQGIIAEALGTRIGRIQNTEFTTYDAADGPQGLIKASTLGVTAAATGSVTADELRRLKYAVNRAYRPGAKYMANDQTVRDIMGLKDGQGRYLFNPDPRDGTEPNIWGNEVVVNNDIPAMATGVVSVEFGDFSHYVIRDVRGFTLLRLDERYAPNLQVSFLGFSRADGGLIDAGEHPIQHIVHP